jgi:hypothetical protein
MEAEMLVYPRCKLRGGALVRFAKVLALVVLLGCSAAVAHADAGADPTVKINKFPDPTGCDPNTDPTCIVQGGSVTVDLTTTTVFDVGGDTPITFFSLSFQGVVGDFYNCFTDIFVNCFMQETGNTVVMDFFTGGPGPCESNGDAGGQCSGEILPEQEFSVQGIGFPDGTSAILNAPEPSSYILLFGGLIALLVFSKKRQGTAFSE